MQSSLKFVKTTAPTPDRSKFASRQLSLNHTVDLGLLNQQNIDFRCEFELPKFSDLLNEI